MSECVGVGRLFSMCVFVCECLSVAVFFCMSVYRCTYIHFTYMCEHIYIYMN